MSQEELAKIAAFTSPNDYGVDAEQNGMQHKKNTSGWRDSSGNLLTDTEAGTEIMREALIKRREALRRDIDSYEKSLATVRSISNNDTDRSEDEVSELAWLLWESDKFKSRFHDIKEQYGQLYNLIYEGLSRYREGLRQGLNDEEITDGDLKHSVISDMRQAANRAVEKQNYDYVSQILSILDTLNATREDQMPIV